MTRREHIAELAATLGARVRYDADQRESEANLTTRTIRLSREGWGVSEEDDERLYWVGLHELGHIATTPRGHLDPLERMFSETVGGVSKITKAEAEAWGWALDNAAFPLTEPGKAMVGWGIASYIHSQGLPDQSPQLERILREVGRDVDWNLGDDGLMPNLHNATAAWESGLAWADSKSLAVAA